MHILLGILSTLSIIAFITLRFSNSAAGLGHLADQIGGAAASLRRTFFRRKATRHPLTSIEDPREATLVLMVAVMKDNGELTQDQIGDLEHIAATRLAFTNPADMVALARWHVRDFVESGAVLHRLGRRLARQCNGAQRQDVIDLVTYAANSGDHPVSTLQSHTIDQLKYRLGDVTQRTLAD